MTALPSTSIFPVIIPAAGIGSRVAAATAKQYVSIGGKTILEHTVQIFLSHNQIGKIIVMLHPEDYTFATLSIANHPQVMAVIGGCERVDSVLQGLRCIVNFQDPTQFVLVHDAARPCVNAQDITRLIERCTAIAPSDNVCGAILACPVTDTIKKAASTKTSSGYSQHFSIIDNTIERSLLWHAQTPQMFRMNELIHAIETGLAKGTKLSDEASAMENCGKNVLLVEGPSSNIKITKPSDIALATFYLSAINKSNK